MSQLHPYMQSVPNYQGPLYQYLHHQQQPPMYHNYMYNQEQNGHQQQQQKRYWNTMIVGTVIDINMKLDYRILSYNN